MHGLMIGGMNGLHIANVILHSLVSIVKMVSFIEYDDFKLKGLKKPQRWNFNLIHKKLFNGTK